MMISKEASFGCWAGFKPRPTKYLWENIILILSLEINFKARLDFSVASFCLKNDFYSILSNFDL